MCLYHFEELDHIMGINYLFFFYMHTTSLLIQNVSQTMFILAVVMERLFENHLNYNLEYFKVIIYSLNKMNDYLKIMNFRVFLSKPVKKPNYFYTLLVMRDIFFIYLLLFTFL